MYVSDICAGTALSNIFVFSALAEEEVGAVVGAMERVDVPEGADVISQGARIIIIIVLSVQFTY